MSNRSRLLDLPKELRLEIWSHLVGSSNEDPAHLWIRRDLSGDSTTAKRFSNSLRKCSKVADITFSLESRFLSPGFANLLHVSRLTYYEALPILYRSTIFHPCDLQGTFSLFLGMLSEFALGCIRRVSLDVELALGTPGSFFYWAVTCAQVAKLSESLRLVELKNAHALLGRDSITKHALLFPLLKIKTPKKLLQGDIWCYKAVELERLFEDTTKEFEAKAEVRRAATIADAAIRAVRTSDEPAHVFKKQISSLTIRNKSMDSFGIDCFDEAQIAHELSTIPGIERFEAELSEWDMVSRRSASPIPESGYPCEAEDDAWAETASTLAGKDREISDDDWELVTKSPLPQGVR